MMQHALTIGKTACSKAEVSVSLPKLFRGFSFDGLMVASAMLKKKEYTISRAKAC